MKYYSAERSPQDGTSFVNSISFLRVKQIIKSEIEVYKSTKRSNFTINIFVWIVNKISVYWISKKFIVTQIVSDTLISYFFADKMFFVSS